MNLYIIGMDTMLSNDVTMLPLKHGRGQGKGGQQGQLFQAHGGPEAANVE